jgi:glucuronate isomerase
MKSQSTVEDAESVQKPEVSRPVLSRRRLLETAAALAAPLTVAAPTVLGHELHCVAPSAPARRSPSSWSSVRTHLHQQAATIRVFDTHEHIWTQDRRQKQDPDFFLLFSHYTSDDLVSAGIPESVWRETQGLQDHKVPLERRWRNLAPYWQFTRSTGYGRCMLIAARDLFGVDDINERTYRTISERIANANRDPQWYNTVLKVKGGIDMSLLDDLATSNGEPLDFDPRFFRIITRMDYIVMADPHNLHTIEESTGMSISRLSDLENALGRAIDNAMHQASHIAQEGLAGIKCALAYLRPLAFDQVPRPDAERAFDAVFSNSNLGEHQSPANKQLQDYMMHRLVEQCAEHHLPMQIHTGMQAGNWNHVAWANPALLSDLLDRYQQVRFDVFHGGYPYLGEQATICKNNRNCYADLCWLHIISPSMARQHLHQLIDTVPGNKILGFGGDFMHVEGAYAHCRMARQITADVLADKVEEGELPEDHAVFLLERILHGNGNELFTRS